MAGKRMQRLIVALEADVARFQRDMQQANNIMKNVGVNWHRTMGAAAKAGHDMAKPYLEELKKMDARIKKFEEERKKNPGFIQALTGMLKKEAKLRRDMQRQQTAEERAESKKRIANWTQELNNRQAQAKGFAKRVNSALKGFNDEQRRMERERARFVTWLDRQVEKQRRENSRRHLREQREHNRTLMQLERMKTKQFMKEETDRKRFADQLRKKREREARTQPITGGSLQAAGQLAMPIGMAIRGGVGQFGRFDKAMVDSTAIFLDSTKAQRDALKEQAVVLSQETLFSAEELAQGYFTLASSGFDAQESLLLIESSAKFAQAGMLDLQTAIELLAGSSNALGDSLGGIPAGLEDWETAHARFTKIANALVRANTFSQATVQDLAFSLTREAASSAKTFGVSMEETLAVLSAFAQQNIKGELAGRAFGRMMRLIQQAASRNREVFEKNHIDVYDDTTKSLRNLSDVLADLQREMQKRTPEEIPGFLKSLGFEARVQQVILPLLKTDVVITEALQKLRAMGDVVGEVADNRLDSFTAKMTLMSHAVDEAGRKFAEPLIPVIIRFSEWIIKLADGYAEWDEGSRNIVVALAVLLQTLALASVAVFTYNLSLARLIPIIKAASMATVEFTAKTIAARLALVAFVAYVGYRVGRALSGYDSAMNRLNEALEKHIILSESLAEGTGKRLDVRIMGAQSEKGVGNQISALKALESEFGSFVSTYGEQKAKLEDYVLEFEDYSQRAYPTEKQHKMLQDYDSLESVQAALKQSSSLLEVYEKRLEMVRDAVKALTVEQEKQLAARTKAEARFGGLGDLTQEQVEWLEEHAKAMEVEQQTFLIAEEAAEVYKQGIAEIPEWYQKIIDKGKEMQDIVKMMDEGRELTENMKDPLEKFGEQAVRYETLLRGGAIAQETYDKAMQKLIEDFDQTKEAADKATDAISSFEHVLAGTPEAEERLREFSDKIRADLISITTKEAQVSKTMTPEMQQAIEEFRRFGRFGTPQNTQIGVGMAMENRLAREAAGMLSGRLGADGLGTSFNMTGGVGSRFGGQAGRARWSALLGASDRPTFGVNEPLPASVEQQYAPFAIPGIIRDMTEQSKETKSTGVEIKEQTGILKDIRTELRQSPTLKKGKV